jgi:CRISPR-associated protein Csh1
LKRIVNAQVGKSSAANHICSICGEEKRVSGDPQIFKFYTIDKPGFIAGGLNKADAWKNFPLCYECKLDIEEGRRYVEQNLKFKFHGLYYFLIPRLLFTDVQPELMKILLDAKKSISLKKQAKKRITNDENDILDIVSRESDVLTVNFLFLSKEQSAERILLLIEDIFPSRIREIFDAKDRVDTLFSNSDCDDFTFAKIRTFFAQSSEGKKNYDLDKYFLEIVDATFRGKKIDFSFLIKFCMAVIRREFIKEEREIDFKKRVNDALMAVMFLKELGLLSFKEASSMKESIFSEVLKKYAGMLNSPAKTGVFLLGALTQLLLSKQYSVRGAKPFKKYLKGLRMDEKDFRALLPKVQNKLEEYDSFDKGKAQIAEEVSRSFLEAGENWKLAVDELNFYFVCGMNLAQEIAAVVYKDKKEKEV